jgi:GT2 family glycosyltransferase
MQKLTTVIVNWNGKEDTIRCLNSLKKIIIPPSYIFSVLVIDNGSIDGSVSAIQTLHPWVEIYETGHNLGFTGGNNVGIKKAIKNGSDYVWLLNNDTFTDKNALSFLFHFTSDDIGIVGSKIYFAPHHEFHKDRYFVKELGKVIWYAGGIIDWNNMYASHKGVDQVDHGQFTNAEQTPFITGCSMCISRKLIEKIGYFDEKYYLYLEDLDYCIRAKNAGFTLLIDPKSVIWHINAGSAGGSGSELQEYYMTRNRMLIGLRYAPLRTKAALVREAIGFVLRGTSIQKMAIKDFFFSRFGKQYEPK